MIPKGLAEVKDGSGRRRELLLIMYATKMLIVLGPIEHTVLYVIDPLRESPFVGCLSQVECLGLEY